MVSIQEPEVQFAQRLASNEKPIRTKAIKKLRKYINARSQKATGGFTCDELLKLWKGLFYCLWMQDKPLLQEELSNQISTLIHSFHDIDGQFLYLESFLQTLKREWTGIDRLRMDKFFQLVRFMFRQTFELLKRNNWESSVVARFLELLTAQLLQIGSGAPSGLQFHILDLYMTELAAVGSAELTADQNLMFIKPFCRTAAKTKDRSLFRAICNSIFSTIIDQAPFAIEDLMKEVKAAETSDSLQASKVDDDEDQLKKKTTSKRVGKKGTGEQFNGNKSNEEEADDDDFLHLEDSDTEVPCDDDIGPVLQFDYAALADTLFELASRGSTPSQNRQRLYKIIKLLRDLSEGVFPQDEYPEDVSTDEDDEMFGSRKRMRRGAGQMDEERVPAAKKSKGKKKEASTLDKQNNDPGKDDNERADLTAKKKRKKKKKSGQGGSAGGEENTERSEHEQIVAQVQNSVEETEGSMEYSQAEHLEKEAQTQSSISFVKVTEGQTETLLLSEVKKPLSVTVTEETSHPPPCTTDNKDQSEKFSKMKLKRETSKLKPEATGEQQSPVRTEPGMSSEADAPVSGKKKKKKKKGLKAKNNLEEVPQPESQVIGVRAEADFPSIPCENSVEDGPTIGLKPTDSTNQVKRKKKNLKANETQKVVADAQLEVEGKRTDAQVTPQDTTAVPLIKKTKKKGKQEHATIESSPAANERTVTPLKMKRKKNRKESKTTVEEEGAVVGTPHVPDAEKLFEITMTTPAKKKKARKMAAAQVDEINAQTQLQSFGSVGAELPLDEIKAFSSSGKPAKKNKRKIPVEFEFEADELQAAAQQAASINGHAEEETVAKKTKLGSDVELPSTPLNTKKSQKKAKTSLGSASALFCKIKGSPSTPMSSKKKSQTPKSESKKVTFGLKNNKTAEFRKTDRSLLVSPDGSSRVPFDPKQKPKFGVLKSLPTRLSAGIKKTPNSNRKTSLNSPKSTPKRRPSAADFF